MKSLLFQALRGKTAVPAFNFYNLESFMAIRAAARETHKPVIFAVSPGAIAYMGDDFVRFAVKLEPLHLDHGRDFAICKHAIDLGFASVMIDASTLPFDENVRLTKKVADYAHKRGVFVEAELGVLCGHEDEVQANKCTFTDPAQAKKFFDLSGCDSLAIAIGTTHGAYKGTGKLRFDILEQIRGLLPKTPLVLHGASGIPQKYAKVLGLKTASGIPDKDIQKAVKLGITKVNVDSDARLAWTAAIKTEFTKNNDVFDPRHFLTAANKEMTQLYTKKIVLISS